MPDKLPTYKITIDPAYSDGEDLGVEQIAFTSRPAIKMKGLAFSAVEKKKFFTDDVKMRIAAPAMIPMEIYRADEDGEYYVEFTAEVIEQLHSKFMLNLTNTGKFNLEHDQAKPVPAYVLEAWIVDEPLKDKAYSTYGMTVPKGTLMVVSQITDKEYYNSLVANDQVGYSIEGFLGMKLSDLAIAQELINKNNKLNEMTLPNGTKFVADGKNWIFNDGKVEEDKTPAAAPAEDKPVDKPEDKPADAPVAAADAPKPTLEDKPVDVPVAAADAPAVPGADAPIAEEPSDAKVDEVQILAVIQPKLDEIYKMIADLKAAKAEDKPADTTATPADTKMSIHDRFSAVMKIVAEK